MTKRNASKRVDVDDDAAAGTMLVDAKAGPGGTS